jgi:branched-chain amino acid transport system substrate-binding protein
METLMLIRARALMAAVLIALAPMSSHAVDGVTPQRIVIGQSIALQGGKNEYGQAVLDGIQAYLAAVNKSGGVAGRTLVLKTLDDENNAGRAEANARQLVDQEQVFILFGSIEGGPSTAVMKVALEKAVPFFGPMAGSPGFRRPHQPLVFPVRAEHLEEFRVLLAYAQRTGMKRAAFVRADSETGQQHLDNVRRVCRDLGMELVADLPFKSDINDAQIAQMAARIASSGAQVVINHGSAGMYERLIRKAAEQKIHVTFSGVNSGSFQLAQRLGPLSHGMVFSQVVPSPWQRKAAITREYQEEFARQKPGKEFSYGSLEGYTTAKALVAALRAAGPKPTRESFVAGLEAAGKLDLAEGLRATYRAGDHTGLTLVDLTIVTRDGKFQH